MKRFLLTSLILFLIVGCEQVKQAELISGYDNSQLTQTIYADQTSGNGDFQFTASESWTTQITTSTKAATSWITLTPASGSAGKVSMKITLEPNTTGADRRAEIRIICGGTSITIVIEQKGTTNPEEPKPEVLALVSAIRETADLNSDYYSLDNNYTPYSYKFEYDNSNRLKEYYVYNASEELYCKYTYFYEIKNQVRVSGGRVHDGQERAEYNSTASLNDLGQVASLSYNIQSSIECTYDQNGYLSKYDNSVKDNSESTVISAKLKWEAGNVKSSQIITDYQYGNDKQENIDIQYSAYENKDTGIDLDVFFWQYYDYALYYPFETYQRFTHSTGYSAGTTMKPYALVGLLGNKSQHYTSHKTTDNPLDKPSSANRLLNESMAPPMDDSRRSYDRQVVEGVYELGDKGVPVRFSYKVKVTKDEKTYKGQREYYEPKDQIEKEELEQQIGPGPWFYAIYEKQPTVIKYDTFKYSISYHK